MHAEASHSKVLKIETHKFEPQGVTGFALLQRVILVFIHGQKKVLHICDIFTCGDGCQPESGSRIFK